ncbi:MAG: iron-sulfur cluster repair di-iron protein [Phycisphaerae bacterium]|jgi:regulator of cell morphogenesis and NO signaling|nr:iron-sulfur cluster repair di-iron protein [Phycisphaerae bacterium]MBT5382994.1 iron-sulfur cluster repair di-iron protein [Phycisphaerae bacterium]MBT5583722.1 iron-sulfur cluster repair di-iron protein [Phycisphaerae bacterium]MBT5657258.1 iron-sulfur cluster repair di-iron protein [Phycisphaerae bacterium]MBT7352397.1 iron-sulfur cluster repair di-iron protein [Phycisphaerae bacterium]
MTITLETPVGEIASQHPIATRVFARHRIDFCCGGGKPLGVVCQTKGIDGTAVVAEIELELSTGPDLDAQWDTAPLDDLIDHIVSTFHRGLDEELPRLETMLRKVNKVHGDKDPERLAELLEVFLELKSELIDHMMKEEQILFPMIQSGEGHAASGPVSAMEHEHDSAGNSLRRIRTLTDDFTPRPDACNTWRALWGGLEQLEVDLHQHIHLENNILFPRALA